MSDWHDFALSLMQGNDAPASTEPAETDPILEALAGFAPGAEGNPLAETGAEVAPTKKSVLPQWAHDIKIAGFDPEQPEMFVWTGDSTKKIEHTTGTYKPIPDGHGGFHIGEPTTTYSTKDVSKAQTITQAANTPYTWDDDEIADAIEKMNDAGLGVESFDEMVSVWEGLVDRAAKTYIASKGEKRVTPWDVLDMTSREIESVNKSLGIEKEKELDPNRRETFTQRSVQDISEGEAWSVLQSNLSNLLGRDPSDDEVRDFTYRMNALAARNPAISKTITQYKNGQAVSQVTNEVDSGLTGDDIMQTAYEDAQSNPEYAEYQASSVYFNALMSGLGAMGS